MLARRIFNGVKVQLATLYRNIRYVQHRRNIIALFVDFIAIEGADRSRATRTFAMGWCLNMNVLMVMVMYTTSFYGYVKLEIFTHTVNLSALSDTVSLNISRIMAIESIFLLKGAT